MARKKAVGTDYVPQYQNNNQKHTQKKVKTSRKKTFWLLRISPFMSVVFIMFLIGMAFVAQHVWLNFLGYQISEHQNKIIKLQETNEKLKLQVASLSSLDKVEEIAINDLGMILPENVHYIFPSQDVENEIQSPVQTAGLTPEFSEDKLKKSEKIYSPKTWLGTVQDFFYYWLQEKG